MLNWAAPALLAVAAGFSIVIQQALNANVRTALDSAAWAGVASYVVGTLCMAAVVLVMRDPIPAASAAARLPWWAWTGGLFGAIYVALAIVLLPKLGSAAFVALLIAGQMLASIAFDHYGLLGLDRRPVDLTRVAGAVLLVAGCLLIRR